MNLSRSQLPFILLISSLIRILPILLLSQYQDIQRGQIFITDIDYKVYSDSTLYSSPYERHTYRYTPLLSYLMIFNYQYAECIGKVIFVVFDILAIWLLWKIVVKSKTSLLENDYQNDKNNKINHANFIAKLYGFNPLFIYLTVRGSCQSIAMVFMYGFWYFMFGNNASGNLIPQQHKSFKISQFQPNLMHKIYAYILYGLWVHFRVYPIIFLPLIFLCQYRLNNSFKIFINRFLTMGIISGGIFIFLLIAFYSLYNWQFIYQTYLYHFIRKDNRHSFSPYFYDIYLNYSESKPTRILPVLCLIFFLTQKFSKQYSMFYIHFLITFGFVQFNTVITLQYYMWVIGAMLLVLPESRILTWGMYRKGFNLILQWFLAVGLWIWMSLKLENQGENIITAMWVICLVKIGLDMWVLVQFMKTIKVQDKEQIKKLKLQLAKNLLLNKQKQK